MMQVVGEEGTSTADFVVHLKAEFLDAVYLQQNSFDPVDAACPIERQQRLFALACAVLEQDFDCPTKDAARDSFFALTEQLRNWNYAAEASPAMHAAEEQLRCSLGESGGAP
jgi:V/A-type H+-transporting ATPase subunit A